MPVTPSYPGIYIQELPSNTHTITAAPTSITVFVGYTHPFKTNPANFENSNVTHTKAVRIFSFTDYEREFGGFFSSTAFDSDTSKANFASVAHAVNQFFLNGGSDAYVIGLRSSKSNTPPYVDVDSIRFTALQPTDKTPMTVAITNTNAQGNVADITITYGTQIETYRKVTLDKSKKQDFIENRIGTANNLISALVTVDKVPTSQDYPNSFTNTSSPASMPTYPSSGANIFLASDFDPVFQQDSELDKLPIFNLLVLPGIVAPGILSEALAFCERKQAFLILDPPLNSIPEDGQTNSISSYLSSVSPSTNGALYFPYIKSTDPITGGAIELPPSGSVAGIYARTDLNRGVWKAPAGLETTINNTTGVVDSGRMSDPRQGVLNLDGIDCLRTFPGVGTVVYGARTLVGYDGTPYEQWKYVPVRRMALFIEQTLLRNLGWVVFEPNDEPLWAAIRLSIGNFMLSLFRQGALQGSTPSQAFQVKCDSSTTTPDDQNNGTVNIVVAFAPLKPAEFVIIKIAQLAGQVQA